MKLFELYADLKLDTANFNSNVKSATQAGSDLAKALGADANSIKSAFSNAFSFSVGQLMAEGFKDGLGFLKDFTADSIKAASDLEEVRNVIDVTFGDDATSIYAWAKNAKNAFGMSELAALDYAGQIGSVLKVQEFAADEVRDMSKAVVELAADYASFKNMNFSETFAMLRSGLRGETESIERLGLTVHVGTMIDYLGLDEETDFTKGMTQAEQIMARYNYIMDKSSFVQGDFARTSNSFANELRTLNTNIEQLQANLGDKFLPVANDVLQFLNFFFEDTKTADEAVSDIRQTFAETYASIETTTANALALVEALKELEEAGVDDPENSSWSQLVNKLLTDIPALGEKIPSTTDALIAGSEAIEGYIKDWRTLQLEAGRSNFLGDYYNILGEKQAAYAKEKSEYETFAIEAEARKALFSQTWTNALNYLQDAYGESRMTADEISNIISNESGIKTAMQSLNALANRGDAGAATFYDVLSQLAKPDELLKQLAIEQNEMDIAYLEMEDAAKRLDVIADALDALPDFAGDWMGDLINHEEDASYASDRDNFSGVKEEEVSSIFTMLQTTMDNLSTMKSDVLSAVNEAISNITITGQITTGDVKLNTGALVGSITPLINLQLGRSAARSGKP